MFADDQVPVDRSGPNGRAPHAIAIAEPTGCELFTVSSRDERRHLSDLSPAPGRPVRETPPGSQIGRRAGNHPGTSDLPPKKYTVCSANENLQTPITPWRHCKAIPRWPALSNGSRNGRPISIAGPGGNEKTDQPANAELQTVKSAMQVDALALIGEKKLRDLARDPDRRTTRFEEPKDPPE